MMDFILYNIINLWFLIIIDIIYKPLILCIIAIFYLKQYL